MGAIRVGTSSWADRSLISSGWYPRAANTPAGRLAHYAERFDLVEVDTTYYALPAVETARAWTDRTPPGFTFNVKAFSLLTGHPTPISALPRQLRPAGRSDRDRLRRRDLPEAAHDELWAMFHAVLEPIAEAGKLGVVLLQFPPWLAWGEAAQRRILHAAQRCRPLRVAVELRHGSWYVGDRALRTLEFLQRHDLSYVCVDMPQGHPSSVPPIVVATAEPALVRFHGHSAEWESGDKQEKFRYAYPDRELREWSGRLRELAAEVDEVHALFNNCCGDQAQRDAARLAELLGPAASRSTAAPHRASAPHGASI
ncbi:DUF72 domain-containing protein [Micromonospora sp. NPDC049559]|uniref:DUF72 domain-containing protein n=1 Tax=Micromonospora sp. NPDC049559 TaxID=3155923 RepID=UPI003438C87B